MRILKNWVLITIVSPTLIWPLLGQDEASMSAPVLRGTPEEISVTTRFSNFVPGNRYRLGVGTAGDKIDNAKIELLKGDTPLSKKLASFRQGYAKDWFEVKEIVVQGFLFSAADLPRQDEELTLKVSIPRAEADRLKKFFVILAKHYPPNRWYIMEGAELDDSLW